MDGNRRKVPVMRVEKITLLRKKRLMRKPASPAQN